MNQVFVNKTLNQQTIKLSHGDSESIVEVKINPGKEFPLYEYYHYTLLEASTEYCYYCNDCYKYILTDECLYESACELCGDTLQIGL